MCAETWWDLGEIAYMLPRIQKGLWKIRCLETQVNEKSHR